MKKLLTATFIFICSATTPLFANAGKLQSHFQSDQQKIEVEILKYKNKQTDLLQLARGPLRQTLFSIQTMANLYLPKYPSLKTIHLEIKKLEDGIGGYRQALEQFEYGKKRNASDDKMKALEKKVNKSAESLADLLKDKQWIKFPKGKLYDLNQVIATVPWDSDEQDKIYSYSLMGAQMSRLDQTEWNMTVLEGNGVHDLRREMRWYKMRFTALNQIMETQSQTCGHPTQAISEKGKCLISDCYHQQMLEIYKIFGDIKDEGEGQEGLGDHVDQELLKPAQEIYAKVKKENLFQNLSFEFNQCAANGAR